MKHPTITIDEITETSFKVNVDNINLGINGITYDYYVNDELKIENTTSLSEVITSLNFGTEYKVYVVLKYDNNYTITSNVVKTHTLDKYYKITKDLQQGISIDNNEETIIHNGKYQAKLTINNNDDLQLKINVTMGGQVIQVDEPNGIINIQEVTGDIEINATLVQRNPIEIAEVSGMDTPEGTRVSKDIIYKYLFDGVLSYNGLPYGGILFDTKNSYFDIIVSKNVTIYAYGGVYNDSGGSTPANVLFKKFDGTSYIDYSECVTNDSGSRYELVTLIPGRYRVMCKERYVQFTEWEYVKN